jgi:hypothetical protein
MATVAWTTEYTLMARELQHQNGGWEPLPPIVNERHVKIQFGDGEVIQNTVDLGSGYVPLIEGEYSRSGNLGACIVYKLRQPASPFNDADYGVTSGVLPRHDFQVITNPDDGSDDEPIWV